MATIANLGVSVTAKVGNLKKGLRSGRKSVGRFASSVSKASKRMAAFGGGLAAIAAGGGLAMLVKRSFDAVDATAKVSDKLGIATEKLIGLRHAADLTGVGISILDTSLQRMTRRIAEAAHGTGVAIGALDALGLSVVDLIRMTPDQQFYAIADAMGGVATQSERVRLAMALFDTEGVALVNTLAGGSAALQEMQEDADALGITFSRVDAAKVEAANDAITRMQAAFGGAAQVLAIELAPYVEALAAHLTNLGSAGGGMGQVVTSAFGGVIKAISYAVDAVRVLKTTWKILDIAATTAIGSVVCGIRMLAQGINWLLELVGVDLVNGFVTAMESMEVALAERLKETVEETKDLIEQPWAHEQAEAALAKIAADAQKNAELVVAAKQAMAAPVTPAEAGGAEKLIAGMQKSIDTFGMSSRAIKTYEAALAGATQQELDHLDALDAKLSAMEHHQSLMEEGKSVFEATRTDAERYAAELERLREIYDAGAIDADTYVRALKQAREQYATPDIQKTVGAAVRGTVAGFSASQRQNKREDELSRIEKLEIEAAKADEVRNRRLDDLVSVTRDSGTAVTVVHF